eukprot:1384269-Amorphochlora_amoeboformis.AAC.1
MYICVYTLPTHNFSSQAARAARVGFSTSSHSTPYACHPTLALRKAFAVLAQSFASSRTEMGRLSQALARLAVVPVDEKELKGVEMRKVRVFPEERSNMFVEYAVQTSLAVRTLERISEGRSV